MDCKCLPEPRGAKLTSGEKRERQPLQASGESVLMQRIQDPDQWIRDVEDDYQVLVIAAASLRRSAPSLAISLSELFDKDPDAVWNTLIVSGKSLPSIKRSRACFRRRRRAGLWLWRTVRERRAGIHPRQLPRRKAGRVVSGLLVSSFDRGGLPGGG